MYDPNAPLVTLEDLQRARAFVESHPKMIRTPMMHNVQGLYGLDEAVTVHLKLENLQYTGSFKSRGAVNQFKSIPEGCGTEDRKLITMSAGSYGKVFANLTRDLGLKGKVLMPDTAPENRTKIIQECGMEVERLPTSKLQEETERNVSEHNMVFAHPFDDVHLIAGHGSAGLEILEEVPRPDVVLVCCGGGGLLAGVAAAIKLSCQHPCRVYGVEPENARTMHESFRINSPASMKVSTVAAGLAPPYAGQNTYRHCRQFVEDILLVTDKEIVAAVRHLYERRLLVEPSGAAAFAALMHDRVPDVRGKEVVVVITGGNVSPAELVALIGDDGQGSSS